ncbi:MAG: exodeoxyribonuclease III [Aeromicrobium sp.]
MRIATWNVNSIRSRIDRVTAWIERSDVDVLALQETKCTEAQFPFDPLRELGYEVAHSGINQWNGVAIVSRVGLEDVATSFAEDQPHFGEPAILEPRSIGATCGGIRIWSLYVPNGRELENSHYTYKLDWFDKLTAAAKAWLAENPDAQIALTGDWNVAPEDDDVWDMAVFEGKTHVSEPERRAFRSVLDAGFTDVVRPHTPGPGVYTFWDYQRLRFPKRQGMRIDFVLASEALAKRVTGAHIDREERKGKGASDHAPVVVDLD